MLPLKETDDVWKMNGAYKNHLLFEQPIKQLIKG